MAARARFDLGLAGIFVLLIVGGVFVCMGLASYLFSDDGATVWTYWIVGIGLWLTAMTIFFTFMMHPVPRHGIRR